MGRTKLLAGLAALVVAGVGVMARRPASEAADPPPPPNSQPAAEAKPAEAGPPAVRVVVLDPAGRPLPGVNVHGSVWTTEKGFKANSDQTTDDRGVATVTLPKTYSTVRLWAAKKGYAGLFANWEQAELAGGKGMPAEYAFRLEPGGTAGGRVVDEQGKPIAGAKVVVTLRDDDRPDGGDGRVRYDTGIASGSDAATTDADGRWRVGNVPASPAARLAVKLNHPAYASDETGGEAAKAAGVTTEMLRAGTAALTLKAGVVVDGRVTAPDGKPVPGALVVHGEDTYGAFTPVEFPTDADGRYRLPALSPRENMALTVIAPGYAPQQRRVDLRPGLPPQDFQLAPGKALRLRFVDAAGRPVPKVYVHLGPWNGNKALHNQSHSKVKDTQIPRWAGPDGVWEWAWAPAGPIKVSVSKQGYAGQKDLEVSVGPERTVTLAGEHRLTGRVTDAVTGRPVPTFTVMHVNVWREDFHSAERGAGQAGRNGRLDFLATRADHPLRLRVEAMGYRAWTGPAFRVGDDSPRTLDVPLQPSPPRTGIVLDPAGQPAADVGVLLATPTAAAHPASDWGNHRTATDAAGRFAFPDPGEPWAVLAESAAGWATAEVAAGTPDAGTLRLRPWAKVRGTFSDGGQPVANATVFARPIRVEGPGRPRIQDNTQTITGPDGTFEFPRLPPGPVFIRVSLGPWEDEGYRSGPSVPLDLRPGETRTLDLGGAGATVTGRVKLTGPVPAGLDYTYSLNHLVRRGPGVAPPADVARLGFDAAKGWSWKWDDTPEGRAFVATLPSWFVKLAPDGSFRVSGVPPGEYDLAVAVYAKPEGCLIEPLARVVARVIVPAAGGAVAVPDVAAPVVPVPAVGDTPAVAFRRADRSAGALADFRGRPLVVAFWASWCGPCKAHLPAVRKLADRGVSVLGLSLDDDDSAWQASLKGSPRPGPQGRLAAGTRLGVSSVPAYWLLDAGGKLVAKGYTPDEIGERLK